MECQLKKIVMHYNCGLYLKERMKGILLLLNNKVSDWQAEKREYMKHMRVEAFDSIRGRKEREQAKWERI